MPTNSQGFTLLEILVAMAIFTLIGLASNAVLSSVLDNDELSRERVEQLEKLQRAMLTIERDVLQATPRSVRLEGENTDIVFTGGRDLFESEADGMAFVRAGWHNPQLMLPRSTLQAVAYRLQDEQLQRLYGNYVDNVIGFEPKIRVLLEQVEDLQIEYFVPKQSNQNNESSNWAESYRGQTLPLAVAIELTHKNFGNIRREFLLTGNQISNASN